MVRRGGWAWESVQVVNNYHLTQLAHPLQCSKLCVLHVWTNYGAIDLLLFHNSLPFYSVEKVIGNGASYQTLLLGQIHQSPLGAKILVWEQNRRDETSCGEERKSSRWKLKCRVRFFALEVEYGQSSRRCAVKVTKNPTRAGNEVLLATARTSFSTCNGNFGLKDNKEQQIPSAKRSSEYVPRKQ